MAFLTSLATNDEEFEKLNDGPRPRPSLSNSRQDKIKHTNQSQNYKSE